MKQNLKKLFNRMKRKVKFLGQLIKKFTTDTQFKNRAYYTKLYKNAKISENVVLYEAYHGKSMTGNPFAVFKELIKHPKYKKFIHIWVLDDINTFNKKYSHLSNVKIISRSSKEYYKYLAIAKYLINDTTFPPFFMKREGQVYINIWHGTPLKNMGIDIINRRLTDHKNIQHNFLFTDYMVTPNKFTAETMLKSHDVNNIYSGKVLDIGYPRVDLMFNADKEQIRKQLNIPQDKKVILYAPTWRGVLSSKEDMSEKLLHEVETIKANVSSDYVVLLKSHYYAYEFFIQNNKQEICVPNSVDTNELLSIVDLLITDYSSIFFDFLPTKNPIIYYAYDYKEYESTRGMYINMNDLPGPLCLSIDEVINHINTLDTMKQKYAEIYEQFLKRFCYHDDGHATERLIETIFEGKKTEDCYSVATDKKKILIYAGGFFNNGITSSVTNLLNNIDYNVYDVTVADYGNEEREEKIKNLSKLTKNAKVVYRIGTWNATPKEWFYHNLFLRRGAYTSQMKNKLPREMYKREFNRLIGDVNYDIVIDFSGYSPFWSSLFAFSDVPRKVIYQHNDMIEQANKVVNKKYPHKKNLKVVFSLYTYFDRIISVSRLTMLQNVKTFEGIIENHEEKMDFVINNINFENSITMKENKQYLNFNNCEYMVESDNTTPHNILIKGYQIPSKNNVNFINIGRLEPEKDQAKLLQSFAKVSEIHDNVRLYLVGEGALKKELLELTSSLEIEDKVIFTGQISNPYSLLDSCDCFVLSSNHEGQPMVLLEALTLNKPIIITDIPGSRSAVEGGYGHIVENSEQGLIDGMLHFINGGKMKEKEFDPIEYSERAIEMFYEKICR